MYNSGPVNTHLSEGHAMITPAKQTISQNQNIAISKHTLEMLVPALGATTCEDIAEPPQRQQTGLFRPRLAPSSYKVTNTRLKGKLNLFVNLFVEGKHDLV